MRGVSGKEGAGATMRAEVPAPTRARDNDRTWACTVERLTPILLGLLLVASACVPRVERKLPAAPPVGSVTVDAGEILQALDARREAVWGVRALAKMAYHSPETSRHARQVILAARPDRLRWEVLSPFGTAFVLTAGNGMIAAYAPGEDIVYRGRATRYNFFRYTGVDLSVAAVVDLLLGTPPLHEGGLTVVSEEDGQIKFWQSSASRVSVCWFNGQLDPLRFERQDDEGRVLMSATFRSRKEIAGRWLPTEVSIELPPSGQRIEIALQEAELNPALEEALFEIQAPPGVTEVDIDQEAQ